MQETKFNGDLIIRTKAEAEKYAAIEEVTGSLDISADAKLPVLTSAGGYPATMPPICINDLDWPITIIDQHMMIGCQWHSIADWAAFDDRRIAKMDGRNAVRFWSQHKRTLLDRAVAAGRSLERVADEVAA